MRVSVIQMHCNDGGDKEANQTTFQRLVKEACNKEEEEKPELVLGPEFALCGYSYDCLAAWKTAERQNETTEQLLCQLAVEHQIYVGVSYLEAREIDGDPHFLNTFALAGPTGTIEGRVSKARPCSVEAYLFRTPPEIFHVIDSGKYKFGVLICYENFLSDHLLELQQSNVDLLLQPFSGPLVDGGNESLRTTLLQLYGQTCSANAKFLQCPAIYCNKVGAWTTVSPTRLAPAEMFDNTSFPGGSAICDASGTELGKLSQDEEGVLTVDVDLGSATSKGQPPVIPWYLGGYADPTLALKFGILFEWLGSRAYNRDTRRQEMAREILARKT